MFDSFLADRIRSFVFHQFHQCLQIPLFFSPPTRPYSPRLAYFPKRYLQSIPSSFISPTEKFPRLSLSSTISVCYSSPFQLSVFCFFNCSSFCRFACSTVIFRLFKHQFAFVFFTACLSDFRFRSILSLLM